jgi:hypothetical protein
MSDQTEDEELASVDTIDDVALVYWTLRQLHGHCRWGRARFWTGTRYGENDVYYIKLSGRDEIVVGSDTKASTHGGMNARGDRIKPHERPRFTTHYGAPWFRSLQGNLGITPGARTEMR